MKLETYLFSDGSWDRELDFSLDSKSTLVFVFGSIHIDDIQTGLDDIFNSFKKATIVGCSTAGEIYNTEVFDNSISISVIKLEKSRFKVISKKAKEDYSYELGKEIVHELIEDDLKSIFILSNVLSINGSELTKGINVNLPDSCSVSGGLAGNGVEFNRTWIIVDGKLVEDYICAVGLYGDSLHIEYGCKCGWRRFGIDRKVTHSCDNVLYTLNNKPALEIYKRFLGEKAKSLPSSALNFPIMLIEEGFLEPKFRAVKAVDEVSNSITLAGNIPQNSLVSFAVANFDDIIDGAQIAAEELCNDLQNDKEALCIGISCVARRVVLKQHIEDELEVVVDTMGDKVSMVGFYSYGEFSKSKSGNCSFHNQTMTLTLIYES